MSQKGTALTGAAVTEEVLDSSAHILKPGSFGTGQKGLQQFYSPEELAGLVYDVIGGNIPVFDPTAGDGSLLKRFPPANSFGVEIDKDQIEAAEGGYKPIRGDIQRVFPLLYRVSPGFPAIVANPPFGLKDWKDETVNDGKPVGSVRLTFAYLNRLLQEDGQYVFVCGRDQFHREIVPMEESKGIYYVAECDDLFEGTTHPCAVAFGVHPDLRDPDNDGSGFEGFVSKTVPREMLDLLGAKIIEERERVIGRYNSVATYSYNSYLYGATWEAVQKEYDRRLAKEKEHKNRRYYDIELVGGKVLNVEPSPYVVLALQKHRLHEDIKGLHRKPLTWFATYERDWKIIEEALALGIISVDPRVIEAVDLVLHETRRTITPLYPIKETQRLGYLTDLSVIKCKKTDEAKNFVRGEAYPITCRTMTQQITIKKPVLIQRGENAGEWKEGEFEQQRKVLRIQIGEGRNRHDFYDSRDRQQDIAYLVEHFELPDPGDVSTRYPEETEEWRTVLRTVQDEIVQHSTAYAAIHGTPVIEQMRYFQIEDIARLLVKGSGVLAWEQGLGKTLGGAAWARSNIVSGRTRDQVLIIAPQDLIPQWKREIKRLFGIDLRLIKTHGEAKKIAKYLGDGGTGWYITYFEALSTNGTQKSELLPEIIVETKTDHVKEKGTGRYTNASPCRALGEGGVEWQALSLDQYRELDHEQRNLCRFIPVIWKKDGRIKDPTDGRPAYVANTYVGPIFKEVAKNITSKHVCPQCKADRKEGWNGKSCRSTNDKGEQCGYSHYLHRVKPMGSLLSTAFQQGNVIVDEGTMIQGDYSARSMVVRGIKGRCRLLMTGTPIKNYISQAFWLLSWALGYGTNRWPYSYQEKSKFEDNHAVIQWAIIGGKKATRKVLAEVTNLSQLWRMLSSSVVRRRKEETGESLVPLVKRPITVPLGEQQREQMEKWIKDFPDYFIETHPDSDVTKAGKDVVKQMAPMLGLGQKLDYTCVVPKGDPDWDWTGVPVSNFTPANLRVLHVTMALVKSGRKVILGSQLIQEALWLTERLEEKGVRAVNFLDNAGNTAPPAKRAKAVQEFQDGDAQVLVATIQALRLGHNIDAASAVVVNGLPWSYDDWDQFIARAHRFTSKRQVDVYVVIPGEPPTSAQDQPTMSRYKWELLGQKGDAAALALDGRLIEEQIEEINEEEVTRQLMEAGIDITGDEVPEEDIEELWNSTAMVDDFEFESWLLEGDKPDILPNPWPDVVATLGEDFFDIPTTFALPVSASAGQVYENGVYEAVELGETVGIKLAGFEEPKPLYPDGWQSTIVGIGMEVSEPEPTEEPVEEEQEQEQEAPAAVPAAANEAIAQLRELGELHTAGVLTDEEFAEMKAALIQAMKTAATPQVTHNAKEAAGDQLGLTFEEVAA